MHYPSGSVDKVNFPHSSRSEEQEVSAKLGNRQW
jgi:hypothetical protein